MATLISIGNALLLMGRKLIINIAQTSFNIKIPKMTESILITNSVALLTFIKEAKVQFYFYFMNFPLLVKPRESIIFPL